MSFFTHSVYTLTLLFISVNESFKKQFDSLKTERSGVAEIKFSKLKTAEGPRTENFRVLENFVYINTEAPRSVPRTT